MRQALFRLAKAWTGYRRPLWLAAQRLLHRPTVTVADQATGLSFHCLRGADRMLGDVFHSQLYDVPLCPVGFGDLVIDVGANHGFAACWFAARGAEVLAFEPSPGVFALLERNVAANNLAPRVRCVRAAVSGRDGRAVLREAPDLGGGMSTIEPGFAATSGAHYDEGREVPLRAIGGLLDELAPRRVRLLKLDCEGSELPILAALTPALRQRIDSIALEYHENAYSLRELTELVLAWPEFHFSKAASPGIANAVLHLVRREAVPDWAARGGAR